MGPLRVSRVQIEGKSFDLTYEQLRNGGFVTMREIGRLRERSMVVPLGMARWFWEVMGGALSRSDGGVAGKKRFGRSEGWVKVRSNHRGRFLELGTCWDGKVSVIFVPRKGGSEPWGSFRSALKLVVAGGSQGGGRSANTDPKGYGRPRTYKEVATHGVVGGDLEVAAAVESRPSRVNSQIGSMTLEGLLEKTREQARVVAREESTAAVALMAREVAVAVAREVAVVVAREVANQMESLMGSFKELFSSVVSPSGIVNGGKNSGQKAAALTQLPPPIHREESGDKHQQGNNLGGSDESDFDYDSDGDYSLSEENADLAGFILNETSPSVVKETPEADLVGATLPNVEQLGDAAGAKLDGALLEDAARGLPSPSVKVVVGSQPHSVEVVCGVGEILSFPASFQEVLVSTVEVDASHKSPCKGLVKDPLDGATLGSKEADDRARIALAEIGCYLTHPTKKAPETPLQVFSRRNKGCRELEKLKTSVNYDKGIKGGLRKGFLV